MAIDLEERAQRGTRIATPEPVGSERDEGRIAIRRDRLHVRTHVIARGDDRRISRQQRGDVRGAPLRERLQDVRALARARIAREFGITRHAENFTRDVPIAREQFGRGDRLPQDRSGTQEPDATGRPAQVVRGEAVHAANDVPFRAARQRRPARSFHS